MPALGTGLVVYSGQQRFEQSGPAVLGAEVTAPFEAIAGVDAQQVRPDGAGHGLGCP